MIQEFVDRFMNKREELKAIFKLEHPDHYTDLVKSVVSILDLDPERITTIDYGDHQGTILYIITTKEYQPNKFWYVRVSYGSCSACDTLQAIREPNYKNPPIAEQVEGYMNLALHVVQEIRSMQVER